MPGLQRKKTIYTPTYIPFRIGYQIYFILIGACCFSLSLSSYILFENQMDYYEFIIENWKEQPITQIRMTNDIFCKIYLQCQEEALADYDWPGTENGCECPYKSLSIGSCSKNETDLGCSDVESVIGETFHFPDMKNSSWFQICATRAKNQSFYYNLPRKNECAEGQIKCGEDEDYFYCTNEQVCPILKIAIEEIALLENQIEATSLESQTLIYTRQMARQLPIVQFRVSEAGVCMRNDERGMSSGRSDYELMKTKKVDCATDPRFEQIIKTDESTFYKINRKSDLPDYLPGYEIDSQYEWGVYQRSYIMWRMKCRGQEYDNFLDQQIYLNEILDNQRDLLIISIIFLLVISIGFSIVSFLNIKGYDWPCIKGSGAEESNYIFLMEILAKLAIEIAQAAIIINSFSTIKYELDFLQQIVDIECSDKYVHSQLLDLKSTIQENVYVFNQVILILFIITTCLDLGIIFFLFVDFLKRRKFAKIQIQNQNLDQNQFKEEPMNKKVDEYNNGNFYNKENPNPFSNQYNQQPINYVP